MYIFEKKNFIHIPDVLKIPIYALNRSAGAFEPIKLKVKFITNFKTFFGYLGLLQQKFVGLSIFFLNLWVQVANKYIIQIYWDSSCQIIFNSLIFQSFLKKCWGNDWKSMWWSINRINQYNHFYLWISAIIFLHLKIRIGYRY